MELIQRRTALSENMIMLARYLRDKGMRIGPTSICEALNTLEYIGFGDRAEFRLVLRSIFAKSLAEQQLFDEHYGEFWKQLNRAVDSKEKQGPAEDSPIQKGPPKQKTPSLKALKSWLHGNKEEEEQELATYSAGTVLTSRDFSGFTEDELDEVMKLIERIARQIANQLERRYKRASRGSFDLRGTMRNNMRRGGELLELVYRKKRRRKLKLVMLCDVSKSMDLYSRFFVQFLYGFQHVYQQMETFVFSTHLYCVSEQLAKGQFDKAVKELADHVPEWSGGTRIGACLEQYLKQYGSKLDSRTLVIIVSDGWDTGDISLLEDAMYEIHKRAARVIWLNPLAGNPNFQPTVQGMAAAMPFIDVFAAAHSVDSLKEVIQHVS
ncbi:MAG: VWA domain-containing protein [Bacteroidota bacterium]